LIPAFHHFKNNVVKHVLLLVFLMISFLCSLAQLPTGKQTDEIKQMIAELKKEITTIEAEIRQAEKDDPESVASLKTQLNTYKTMLAAFDKSNATIAKPKPATTVKTALPQTPSPIVKAHLKAPVVTPTAAQAKDRLFWYKGKKINDSTLVTTKKTVVQYSRKRQILIVEPDEKKDTAFVGIAKRIAKGEQVKRDLIEKFDKMQNGFIYYPYLENSLVVYDDLTKRFSEAVNNTIKFKDPLPNIPTSKNNNNPVRSGKGPNTFNHGIYVAEDELLDSIPDIEKVLQEQLDDAEKKMKQLPSIESFPAPPRREIGRCSSCDTSVIGRQRRADSLWLIKYGEPEQQIINKALSAMHAAAVLLGDSGGELVDRGTSIFMEMMRRGTQKAQILFNRFGNDIHYFIVVAQVILGHERRSQLLGTGEGSDVTTVGDLAEKLYSVYKKHYDEQVAAKNHDFVLNVPFHIGVYRQFAMLGGEEKANLVSEYMQEMKAYNHFALTMDMDFVWQVDGDGKLQRRITGTMEIKEKVYVWLYPDGCNYRILAHGTDLNNKKLGDITLPMKVKGGIETIREDNDKLKDYPYSGAQEVAFRFPDSKINFCDNGPDTLYLSVVGGNEELAAQAQSDMQDLANTYNTMEMLVYANQVLMNENTTEAIQGTQEAGARILNTISGFMQQGPPANTLDKMKTQYEGHMQMDNQRIGFENAYASKTARIAFNANNRSTVLTDTYLDTKRTMDTGVEIKKGLFHLKMVHEPKGK
jgi:hypothetical protein